MDLKALKLELLQYIIATDSKELLDKLLNTVKREQTDFWSTLTEDQKSEIELARKQIERGEVEDWEALYQRLSTKAS